MSENENNRIYTEASDEKLTLGQKVSDVIAKWGGSWAFIAFFTFLMIVWITINSLGYFSFIQWDKYPYILLNLILSTIAAIQAPIIMMSQNRQAEKDRLHQKEDRDVNKQAELEIRNLKRKIIELQQEQTRLLQDIRNSLRK
jgi:uncharacterized membrane protein